MAPRLSTSSRAAEPVDGLDTASAKPSSVRNREVYTASLEVSEAATISASHDERETDFCFLEPHMMAACASRNTQPLVECLTAQSESE